MLQRIARNGREEVRILTDSERRILENRLELATHYKKYWHKAFCISMFFHGLISFPVLIGIIGAFISAVAK